MAGAFEELCHKPVVKQSLLRELAKTAVAAGLKVRPEATRSAQHWLACAALPAACCHGC